MGSASGFVPRWHWHFIVRGRNKSVCTPSRLATRFSIWRRCGRHRQFDGSIAATDHRVNGQARSRLEGPSVIVSFDLLPLFCGLIQPPDSTRRRILARAAGADVVLILRTTAELLQLTAADFAQVVQERSARAMIEGEASVRLQSGGRYSGPGDPVRWAGVALTVPPVPSAIVHFQQLRARPCWPAISATPTFSWAGLSVRGVVGTGQPDGRLFSPANLAEVIHSAADGVYAVGGWRMVGGWATMSD